MIVNNTNMSIDYFKRIKHNIIHIHNNTNKLHILDFMLSEKQISFRMVYFFNIFIIFIFILCQYSKF